MTFAITGIAAMVITEVLRGIFHRRRVQRDGIGATQDIAVWGTLVTGLCAVGALASGVGWFFAR